MTAAMMTPAAARTSTSGGGTWMKESAAALVLMAVLATAQIAAGCAEAELATASARDSPAVISPDSNRLKFEGFSILAPQGDGWERLSTGGVSRLLLGFDVLYIKAVSATELSHAYVVAHRVPDDSENPKILEDSFARFIESRGAPSVIVRSNRDPPNCLRWEMAREARERFWGIQFGGESVRVSQFRGYLCAHPDDPAFVIEIGYFDTLLSGTAKPPIAEGEAFIHGLAFAPFGVKLRQYSVGEKPRGVALADGALWLTEEDSGTVVRVDPESGAVAPGIAVGGKPEGPAAGFGALWVPNWACDSVSRIDTQRRQMVASIPAGGGPSDVAVSANSVWVTNEKGHSLSRIDPHTNQVTATIAIDGRPVAIAANEQAVWVEDFDTDRIWRIDPLTNRVVATIRVGQGRHLIAIAPDGDSVWASNSRDRSVSRIDPATNQVVATITVGRTPMGLVATDKMIWVANFGDNTVSRIDPRTNLDVGEPLPVGKNPFLIGAGDKSVWVLSVWDWNLGTLTRISGF
jgi:virginiamycin B lyase